MVALSQSVMKNRLKRLLAEKSPWRHIRLAIKLRYLGKHASQIISYYGTVWRSHDRSFTIRHEKPPEAPPSSEITMASYPACKETSISRKPCIPDKKNTIERYQEVMVALSESIKKNPLKRLLAEKSRWRHIGFAIIPRYLGNHASPIKSYYRTLSGSHGRSFRIRHKKLPEAPPSGEIMITSYPVGNETLLSRKLCILDKKLLKNAIRKYWSLCQNQSWKFAWSALLRRNHDDVMSGLQYNLVISETMHPR